MCTFPSGKTLRRMWIQFAKTGNPSLSADISPDGKAHERGILDWDRGYGLTKYYFV